MLKIPKGHKLIRISLDFFSLLNFLFYVDFSNQKKTPAKLDPENNRLLHLLVDNKQKSNIKKFENLKFVFEKLIFHIKCTQKPEVKQKKK